MVKALLAATALSALMMGSAAAGELALPTFDDPAVSDWDGLYGGLTGALWFEGPLFPGFGVEAGANIVSGDILFGGEFDLAYYATAGNFDVGVTGRVGVVTDAAVIYGSIGVGTLSNDSPYVPVGGGVEFMVADSLSLDLSGEYLFGEGFTAVRIGTALNWHF